MATEDMKRVLAKLREANDVKFDYISTKPGMTFDCFENDTTICLKHV